MTNEQKQTLDTIVEAFKKAAKQLGMEFEISDYEKFIKENPDVDQIPINIKACRIPEYIQIEFNVNKNE